MTTSASPRSSEHIGSNPTCLERAKDGGDVTLLLHIGGYPQPRARAERIVGIRTLWPSRQLQCCEERGERNATALDNGPPPQAVSRECIPGSGQPAGLATLPSVTGARTQYSTSHGPN